MAKKPPKFSVNFLDFHRRPQVAPNPDYPKGIAMDGTEGLTPACKIYLPYPAKGVGHWHIVCNKCGLTMRVTAAGRKDDPTSVKVRCLPQSKSEPA